MSKIRKSWRTLPSTKADLSLAAAKFSDAQVDVTLLGKRLRWGTVGDPIQTTSLIYLKVLFYQPKECRLRWTKAELDLEAPNNPQNGLYIAETEPEQMCGEPCPENVAKNIKLAPHVEASGIGLEIGEYSKERSFTDSYRWSFTFQRHPDENGKYTKLAWKWEEQTKGSSVPFERPIFVAVVVDHDGKPFTIQPRLDARLTTLRYGFRNLRIVPVAGPGVLLEPEASGSLNDLTADIHGLQKAIEEENRQHAPAGNRL